MAVAVQEPTTSVDFVTGAIVANYLARAEDSIEVSLAELIDAPKNVGSVRAVVGTNQHLAEVVLDEESPVHSMAAVAWELDAHGLRLNVLVGLERMGEAHIELRGTPCTLQGWWFADDDVHFTGFETP